LEWSMLIIQGSFGYSSRRISWLLITLKLSRH